MSESEILERAEQFVQETFKGRQKLNKATLAAVAKRVASTVPVVDGKTA